MDSLFDSWTLNPPAIKSFIDQINASLKRELPAAYRRFYEKHNGGEGFAGDRYIVLWPIEDVMKLNSAYEVGKYAPGICLFGSDGAGEAYGFDLRDAQKTPVVRIPFIGMELAAVLPVANSFEEMFISGDASGHSN